LQTKDYFIKDSGISAYTINAFVEAIVEATKAGQSIDYNSARRIGMSFSCSFAQEGESVETQAPAQEEAPESPAQPEASAEESSDERSENASDSEGESSGEVEAVPTDATPVFQGNERPFTVKDIEQAADSMEKLKQLGDPVGVSARSKREMVAQLKEYIGA